jgi:hypothetical protein
MKKSIINLTGTISNIFNKEPSSIDITVYENSSQTTLVLEEFVNHFNPEDVGKGLCHLMFKIEIDKKLAATFTLNDMFGCDGILVFSQLTVVKSYRNKGLSKTITSFIVDFGKYYGYGMVQAIDIDTSEFQKKSFTSSGWKVVETFVNPKSGNRLNVWFHNLNEI